MQDRTPAVSVLMPAYNRAAYIGQAIWSVLDQQYRDLELIVVDDGSTDGTPEVVRRFRDPRVRLLLQAHRGASAARNTALGAARGRYIALADSDDLWLPDLLAHLAPVLDASPDVGVAYARAQAIDDAGRLMPLVTGAPMKFPGDPLRSLLYGDHLPASAALCRAGLIRQVGGWDERLVATEDWDIWLRLALLCRFHCVDKVLACFRVHPGRATDPRSPSFARLLADRVRVVDLFYAREDPPPAAIAMRPIAYSNVYIDVGLRWLRAGAGGKALLFFHHALRVAPSPVAALGRMIGLVIFYQLLRRRTWAMRLIKHVIRKRYHIPRLRSLVSTVLPRRYHPAARAAFFRTRTLLYAGRRVVCPCCGGRFRRFISTTRPDAVCPGCDSLERHRLLTLFLAEQPMLRTRPLRVLHIAPEYGVQKWLRGLPNLTYVSADLRSPLAMLRLDVRQIACREAAFDLVLCYHVLEHVVEDRQAMRELRRVLRPGGSAFLQVPLDRGRPATYEDPRLTSAQQQLRAFGQADHVRVYGRDYYQRLADAGFIVCRPDYISQLSADQIRLYGLMADEELCQCSR